MIFVLSCPTVLNGLYRTDLTCVSSLPEFTCHPYTTKKTFNRHIHLISITKLLLARQLAFERRKKILYNFFIISFFDLSFKFYANRKHFSKTKHLLSFPWIAHNYLQIKIKSVSNNTIKSTGRN